MGLGSTVYLWSANKGKVTKLTDLGSNDSVTSVWWSKKDNYLSIGTYKGILQIWDSIKCKQIRSLLGH